MARFACFSANPWKYRKMTIRAQYSTAHHYGQDSGLVTCVTQCTGVQVLPEDGGSKLPAFFSYFFSIQLLGLKVGHSL